MFFFVLLLYCTVIYFEMFDVNWRQCVDVNWRQLTSIDVSIKKADVNWRQLTWIDVNRRKITK